MRKTLNVVLAVVLTVAMIASFAYIATPEKSSDYQFSLVSAKVVNVQDTAVGVRSYADLVDTTRIFQTNEVIYLAITTEVKNLEKYPTLKSIDDKDIDVIVGSPSIDLSYAKLTSPVLLANVWSAGTAINVSTIGYVAPAGNMLEYDKAANEVSWTYHGVPMYGMKLAGHVQDVQHLVTFDPYFNTADKTIEIPAIKLKSNEARWILGGQTFTVDYVPPESVAYTMVITGVTKDNAGMQKGTFYAKLLITGAEKFEDYDSYWLIAPLGHYSDAEPTAAFIRSLSGHEVDPAGYAYRENRDYVKIDVDKLEIAGGYTIYKYTLPASAVMNFGEMLYNGDYSPFNPNGTKLMWDAAATVGRANPNLFDNATNKGTKMGADFINVAGGVRSVKAWDTYADYLAQNGNKSDYPITSVVYLSKGAVYGPGYWGGEISWGGAAIAPNGGSEFIKEVPGIYSAISPKEDTDVIDVFTLELTQDQAAAYKSQYIKVMKADYSPTFIQQAIPAVPATDFTLKPVFDMYGIAQGGYNGAIAAPFAATSTIPSAVVSNDYIDALYGKLSTASPDYAALSTRFLDSAYPYSATAALLWGINNASQYKYGAAENVGGVPVMIDPTGNNFQPVYNAATGKYTVTLAVNPNGALKNYVMPFSSTSKNANSLFVYYEEDPTLKNANNTTMSTTVPITDQRFVDPTTILKSTTTSSDFILPTGVMYDGVRGFYAVFTQDEGIASIARAQASYDFKDLENLWDKSIYGNFNLTNVNQISKVHAYVDVTTVVPAAYAPNDGTGRGRVAMHDFTAGAPTTGYLDAAIAFDPTTHAGESMISDPASSSIAWAAKPQNVIDDILSPAATDQRVVFGFKNITLSFDSKNQPVITLSDFVAYKYDGTKWSSAIAMKGNLTQSMQDLGLSGPFGAAAVPAFVVAQLANAPAPKFEMNAGFTFWKTPGREADPFYYTYNGAKSVWAYTSDVETAKDWLEGTNGVVIYTICSNTDENPIVSVASEKTYFTSEDGYGICLFDGSSNAFAGQFMGKRIYRSNDSNLTYSTLNDHVQDSAKKIAALRYFDLDTSFQTVNKVTDATFESKGAAAVYSEAVEGTFNYGTIKIVEEVVETGTEEEEVDTEDGEEVTDETGDETGEEVTDGEETTDDAPVDDAPAKVPATADANANVAIALTAAAIVAAAGLAFVMKKVR